MYEVLSACTAECQGQEKVFESLKSLHIVLIVQCITFISEHQKVRPHTWGGLP